MVEESTLPARFGWHNTAFVLILLSLAALISFSVSGSAPAEANHVTLVQPSSAPNTLGVNAKNFGSGRISTLSSSVFWFGELDAQQNHADVRIGTNQEEIQIVVSVFDRWLFYDESADSNSYENFDSVSVYLSPAGSSTQYRFQSQLYHWQSAADYRQASKNSGAGYELDSSINFSSSSVWQGGAPNSTTQDDRGWYTQLNIPFSAFGISAPASGTVWQMALVVHDRDDAAGDTLNSQIWPATASIDSLFSWGELRFGRPDATDDSGPATNTVSLRHGVNGAIVPDTHVGGGANCGVEHDPDFFDGWSTHNFPNAAQINIQNQMNIEDWPCFSKYFISFDLNSLPAGAEITSAKLDMFMFGNAGPPGQAKGSTLQMMTVDRDWNESSLNWRNAPSVVGHVSETWIDPINNSNNFADPAIRVSWDIESAVEGAHQSGAGLNLAIYSADWDLHSGKYFYSSDAPDDYHRPILTISYKLADEPAETPTSSPTSNPTETVPPTVEPSATQTQSPSNTPVATVPPTPTQTGTNTPPQPTNVPTETVAPPSPTATATPIATATSPANPEFIPFGFVFLPMISR